MAETMQDLLEIELLDALSAERQALDGMEAMLDAAASQGLRRAIQEHMAETRRQIERLEQAAQMLGIEPDDADSCEGIQGLLEEAQEMIDLMEPGPLRDVALVAAAQKVEHYEIAAYGTLCALLGAAGQPQAAALLAETLEEEKAADARLSQLAEREINPEALRRDQAANDPDRRGAGSAA
ncbi:YciE/YciF ferroxidase family protein [Caldovatus aquaticus]|uniref:DUF892 family protein n=1 Tax=Caldovatus aquaticus TaxID=2865671 RepID=A0ABS7F0X3_9PROT|nr:DUF892 family protein [Caldovatus aquaticus]MBW8269259.1 DUF892 family protein [Caldovatus aquaticus]